MAELDITNAFNDCVDRIAQGQSIEDCLRRYPQFATSLRPMLEAGLLVQRLRIQPTDVLASQTRVRRRFEDALHAPPPRRVSVVQRVIYSMAAILIFSFISVGGLATISQNSLPGDALYSAKLFTEGLQKSFFGNDALKDNFNQRRIQEIQQLLALGRSEEVAFDGIITAQTDTNWTIASLLVIVPKELANAASAHLSDEVAVVARTSSTSLLTAVSIHVREKAETPLSTPTETATVTSIAIPATVPTATPIATLSTTTPIVTLTAKVVLTIILLTPTECVPLRPGGWVTYKIRTGDTLSVLASSGSATLAEVMAVNCITDASRIFVGETIYLSRLPSFLATATSSPSQNSGSSDNNSDSDNFDDSSGTDNHEGGSDEGSDD